MKKIKKQIAAYVLALAMMLSTAPMVHAQGAESTTDSNSDIIICVTTIEEVPNTAPMTRASYSTKTLKKTTTYMNKNKVALWYVSLTATFQYNGTNAGCLSASVSAGSYNSDWKVSDKRTSVSGATATAYATGKHYSGSTLIETVTKSVSLHCTKDGVIN